MTILDLTTKMTLNTNHQSNSNAPFVRRNGEGWHFEWQCGICMDSGIEVGLLGPEPCDYCHVHLDPVSYRVYGAVSYRRIKNLPIDESLLTVARALVSANAECPMPGEALMQLLGWNTESQTDIRAVKDVAKRLRDEWSLPVIGSRKNPKGYFIARTAEQFLTWGRVTRAQAISELATYYRLFKTTFPELAGQESFDFVNTVSTELQEAIR